METQLCYNRLETRLEIRLALPLWQTNLVSPLESLLNAYLQFDLALDRQISDHPGQKLHYQDYPASDSRYVPYSVPSKQQTMVSRKIDPESNPLAYGHEHREKPAVTKKRSLHQRLLLACQRLARVKRSRLR